VDAYMAKVAERKLPVRISSPWPEGRELVMAMVQTGRHREMMGEEKGLTLRGALDGAVDGEVPAIWVIQGDEDDLVRFSFSLSLSLSLSLFSNAFYVFSLSCHFFYSFFRFGADSDKNHRSPNQRQT